MAIRDELLYAQSDLDRTTSGLDLGQTTTNDVTSQKINTLKQNKANKLGSLYKPTTITGMDDADTYTTSTGEVIRESDPLYRYDATEIGHAAGTSSGKSDRAMLAQRTQAAQYLKKHPNDVTDQDLLDIGNMQQIQKLADIARSPGEARWEAPFIPNVEQTNLTGDYTDPQGRPVSAPLNVEAGVYNQGKDRYGRTLGAIGNLGTGIDVTREAAADPRLNAFAPGVNIPDERSVGEVAANTAAALGATFAKEAVVDTADWLGESLKKATGFGWDVGSEETKTELVNGLFGFDQGALTPELNRAKELSGRIYDGFAQDDKEVTMSDVGELVKIGVTNLELLGQSLGYLGALTLGFGKFTKAGKLASGIKADAKAGKITDSVAKKQLKEIDVIDKTKELFAKNAGLLNVAAGNVNDQIDDFKKANDGKDPEVLDVVRMYGTEVVMNGLDRFTDISILKTPNLLAGVTEVAKGLSKKQLGTVATAVAAKAADITANAGKEAAQEYVQEMGQIFNTQFGTEEYGSDVGEIITDPENIIEAGTAAGLGAGGAVQFKAIGGIKSGIDKAKEVRTAKQTEDLEKSRETAKADISAAVATKPNDYTKAYIDSTNVEDISGTKVFEPISNIKAQSTDDASFVENLEAQKQHVLTSAYKINNSGEITGLTEEMSILAQTDKEAFDTRINKVDNWIDSYANEFKDAEGNFISDAIKKEVDYLGSQDIKDISNIVSLADKTAEGIKADKTGIKEAFSAMSDEDKTVVFRANIKEQIDASPSGAKFSDDVLDKMAKRATDTFNVSGFSLSEGLDATFSPRELSKLIADEANIPEATRLQRQKKGEPSIESSQVTSSILANVLNNGLSADVSENLGIDTTDSKVRLRVSEKLDPVKEGMPGNSVKALTSAGKKIKKAVKGISPERVSKVLKGDNVDDNLTRLAVVALNAINSATVSDTELRRTIDDKGVGSNLQRDEYYAGETNVITQIGKDYATSFGIQIEGSQEKVLKAYRDIGKLGIDLLSQEGVDLVETTGKGEMFSAIGDNTFTADNKKITVEGAKDFTYTTGNDNITGDSRVLYADTGIRLKGTNPLIDPNRVGGETPALYNNDTGDAIKRLSKLILPNQVKVPSKEVSEEPLQVAPDTTLNKEVEETMYAFRKEEFRIEPRMLEMLKEIKKVRDEYDGNIYKALKEVSWLPAVLGTQETGAVILGASETGSNNAKIDAISSILDNLDNLDDTFHFEYQTDVNNRITVMETVLNFQHDKVFSRQVLTGGKEFKITEKEDIEYLVNNVAEELDLADTAQEYSDVREAMINGTEGVNERLDAILVASEIMDSNATETEKLESLAEFTAEGNALSDFKGNVFKLRNLLNAVSDIKDSAEDGTITTSYMTEMDASASGVFNTMINIAGRNPELFRGLLEQLGVSFDGKGIDRKVLEDAYQLLANKVDEKLEGSEAMKDLKAKAASKGLAKGTKDLRALLDSLKGLGINMRTLAKPPVMTWFYSAGEKTITKELTGTLVQQVVTKAVNGNTDALNHLKEVTGNQGLTVTDVIRMRPGSKDHKKIVSTYNTIGKEYSSQLTKAFPEVTNYKKEASELFKAITANSTIKGKDYWGGMIRSASTALLGKGRTMDAGVTSINKSKNMLTGKTDLELKEAGLIDEEKHIPMLTTSVSAANESSILPGQAHNVDAAQLLASMAKLVKMKRASTGVMTVHDAEYGNVSDLLATRDVYEEAAIDLALDYDMIDNIILAAEQVTKNIQEDIDNGTLKGDSKVDGVKAISRLNTIIDLHKIVNDQRIEAKRKLLKGAKANMFGVQKADTALDEDVAPVVKKPKVVKPTPVTEPVDTSTPFDDNPLDNFLSGKRDTQSVNDLLDTLATTNDRAKSLRGDTDGISFGTYDETAKKTLRKELGADKFKTLDESQGSFVAGGVIYLRGSKDPRTGRGYTEETVLDVIAHEVEHAIVDTYLDKAEESGKAREYEVLKTVIKRLKAKKLNFRENSIATKRLGYIVNGNLTDLQAVKELVAIYQGEPAVREEMLKYLGRNIGTTDSKVRGWFEALKNKAMEAVSKLTNGIMGYKEIVETLPEKDKDIDMAAIITSIELASAQARLEGDTDVVIAKKKISEFDNMLKDCKI